MKPEEFARIFDAAVERNRDTLIRKGEEYTRGTDRFSNFKKAAGLLGCSQEKALHGMLVKHLVSISDLVDDLEGNRCAPIEMWREKIGDIQNYLYLLEGMIVERLTEKSGGSKELQEEDRADKGKGLLL
ncbi:MAG: hypothetical protein IT388_00625 [Nitrospirales bacterium]|nr:hypothetical protein [Nitrospirales bacterium]